MKSQSLKTLESVACVRFSSFFKKNIQWDINLLANLLIFYSSQTPNISLQPSHWINLHDIS